MEKDVCESRSLPDEMLYGRAGYLYTLLHLQKELGEHTVNKQSIINVCSIKMLTYYNLLFFYFIFACLLLRFLLVFCLKLFFHQK